MNIRDNLLDELIDFVLGWVCLVVLIVSGFAVLATLKWFIMW